MYFEYSTWGTIFVLGCLVIFILIPVITFIVTSDGLVTTVSIGISLVIIIGIITAGLNRRKPYQSFYDNKEFHLNVKDLSYPLDTLSEIKEQTDSLYEDNFNKSDIHYYYDTIDIKKIEGSFFSELQGKNKKVSISEFFNDEFNLSCKVDCIINRNTEELKLQGAIKSIIENGETKIFIGDYILSQNEQINSLINKDNVSLDIIYDKSSMHDNYISKYVVINATSN